MLPSPVLGGETVPAGTGVPVPAVRVRDPWLHGTVKEPALVMTWVPSLGASFS
jgi:hypothetical protein